MKETSKENIPVSRSGAGIFEALYIKIHGQFQRFFSNSKILWRIF
jgi:hypothetical protein